MPSETGSEKEKILPGGEKRKRCPTEKKGTLITKSKGEIERELAEGGVGEGRILLLNVILLGGFPETPAKKKKKEEINTCPKNDQRGRDRKVS